MVRLRAAAEAAAALPAPRRARHVLFAATALALAVLAGCSSAAARGEPSNLGVRPGSPAVGNLPRAAAPSSRTGSTPSAADLVVERAWTASKLAFYEAARLDDPWYRPFLASLVGGGPVFRSAVAFLGGMESAGVRGPSSFRVGAARVVALSATRAIVEGCLYDTGSVFRVSGAEAPASLGGGAGWTASHATLLLVRGRWLVLSDLVSGVASPRKGGPCHGF